MSEILALVQSDYLIILWLVVLIASIIIEAFTTELVSIYSAIGSLVALILAVFVENFWIQLGVYSFFTIVTLLVTRPIFIKYFRKNEIKTNSDALVGQQFILTKGISKDSFGEIRINGVVWTAKSHDSKEIEIGNSVEILSIEGSKVIVERIK